MVGMMMAIDALEHLQCDAEDPANLVSRHPELRRM
jgi:hypothetical protein